MNNKNNTLVTLALLGLAAGSAICYLLTTDDGKNKLKKTNANIQKMTKKLKSLTQKESRKMSSIIANVKNDIEKIS